MKPWRSLLLTGVFLLGCGEALRADITNGLAAYWKMDETNGLTAFDSTANGHNAALTNFLAGNSQWVTGRTNGALNFNAFTNNQWADVPDVAGKLNFGGVTNAAFTLAAWVRGNTVNQSPGAGVICRGWGRGDEEYTIDIYAGGYRFYVRNSAGASILIGPIGTVSTAWQHLVATCDCAHTNGGLNFYLDGQLVGTTASPSMLLSNSHDVTLGSRESNNISGYTLPFYGAEDDVRIYNRALSASDVQELYNAAGALPAIPDSEFAAVRALWLNTLNGGTNLNTNDPNAIIGLNTMAAVAQSNWSSMMTSPTRPWLWNDLPQPGTNSVSLWYTYQRLRTMALACATPGCALCSNASLCFDLTNALDWMNANVYTTNASIRDNWWHWQIGAPLWLNDITVLLHGTLTGTQITNYMNAITHFTPAPSGTAANLVWEATVVGICGANMDDSSKLTAASAAMSSVFPYVTSSDGFYTDGSFIQHGIFAYTGSYGASLLIYIAPWLYAVNGSRWAVTDPNVSNVYQWVYNSFQPFIYSSAMMSMVRGRAMSRQDETDQYIGEQTVSAIIRLAQSAPPADAANFNGMAKYWIQSDTAANFLTNTTLGTLPLALNIVTNPAIVSRGELIGHYNFGSMDRVVHLRPGYAFAISMTSSRIADYESINAENFRGWYTGFGMTSLYNADQTQFDDNFWPTVDSYSLPGTTVDSQSLANSAGASSTSPYNWVGGAALGNFGSAGMQFKEWNSDLTGKKSWFMFDNEIICLGAGITSTNGRPVQTVVENRKLDAAGDNAFVVNNSAMPSTPGWSGTMNQVSWAHLAGDVPGSDIGYYFPSLSTVEGYREARAGSWYDINTTEYTDTLDYTRDYLKLWFNHGVNPSNAVYSYVLLPGMSAAQTAAYSATPPISVLQNTAAIQSAMQIPLGLMAVNFWNDGPQTSGALMVNHACATILQLTETNLALAVSDPTHTNSAGLTVTVNHPVGQVLSLDPGVTVVRTSPTLQLAVNTAGAAGKSFHANFVYSVTSFSGFQGVHFSPAQLAQPSVSGPSADPDGDGVNNLMEYALMQDPWQANPPAFHTSLSGGHFVMTYIRREPATDLSYAVGSSTNLISWDTNAAQFTQSVIADNGVAQTVQVTDNSAINGAARYYCLFVSLLAPP
jgi:hypothetical protein